MTDVEISRRLALAIGYTPKDVMLNLSGGISVQRSESPQGYAVPGWYSFDYRDGETIWPIAEAYNCFPQKMRAADLWSAPVLGNLYPRMNYEFADTAAKVVALAVIKHHEGSKT